MEKVKDLCVKFVVYLTLKKMAEKFDSWGMFIYSFRLHGFFSFLKLNYLQNNYFLFRFNFNIPSAFCLLNWVKQANIIVIDWKKLNEKKTKNIKSRWISAESLNDRDLMEWFLVPISYFVKHSLKKLISIRSKKSIFFKILGFLWKEIN